MATEYPGRSVQTIAVGKWLRGVRGSRTREEFEALIGFPSTSIEKWESGKRRMRSDILARILTHCTPEQRAACPALRLGETEPPPRPRPPPEWSTPARAVAEAIERLPETQREGAMLAVLSALRTGTLGPALPPAPVPPNVHHLKKRT